MKVFPYYHDRGDTSATIAKRYLSSSSCEQNFKHDLTRLDANKCEQSVGNKNVLTYDFFFLHERRDTFLVPISFLYLENSTVARSILPIDNF